ncbi:hypothetical protein [Bhargavaea ginsengi]|uniref:hypothetical protein n=1 Tax=Bhargavaea ginsengi TaxID=426757 RepID=UPI003C73CF69
MNQTEMQNILKQEMPNVLRGLDAEIAEAKNAGDVQSLNNLQGLRAQMTQTNGFNFNRLVFDFATLELPANSVNTDQIPPFKLLRNDPYLICCGDSVAGEAPMADATSVYDPCGCGGPVLIGPRTVAGYINWYLKICLDTTFGFFWESCPADNELPFTATGTTCVNQELCEGGYGTDLCPTDFCDTISFAIRCKGCPIAEALALADNKIVVTYLVVHILPNCEGPFVPVNGAQ